MSGDRRVANHETRQIMANALRALYSEHRSIAAVLHGMQYLVQEQRSRDRSVDPRVFRAMLYYLDVFAEREHHPKEEDFLFPALRRRSPEAVAVLDELGREHEHGERSIRELEQALLRYEEGGEREFLVFAAAVERYVGHYFEHMRKEEQLVMPLAEKTLTAADWSAIEDAFASHRDPLHGAPTGDDYDALFTRIVNLAPAPIGFGPAAAGGDRSAPSRRERPASGFRKRRAR
jgi:hemerythrin-like domain-containing protein